MATDVDTLNASVILKEITEYINKDVSIIDALVYFADKHGVEIEIIGEIVRRSPTLKNRVREDAEVFKLIAPDPSKLPI